MTEQIVLRELKKQDYKALEDIIRKTWKYDDLCSSSTAKKLARVYLSSCLTNQTFARVAVGKGKPVGVIMGKNVEKHRCPLRYRIRAALSVISMLLSKEGRAVAKIFGCISGIDEELLKSCQKEYKGELAFFAIDSSYRGKGVGKMLFNKLEEYMEAEKIKDFYLFTDTSCNFGFYEHQGMRRCCQKEHAFQVGKQRSVMTFFLYEKTVDPHAAL